MGRTASTEPQCLYRVHFTYLPTYHNIACIRLHTFCSYNLSSFDYGTITCDMMQLLNAIELTAGGIVQHTFTHKKYTVQHNKTEYSQRKACITIRIRNLQNCSGIQIIQVHRRAVPILNGSKRLLTYLRKYNEYTGSRNAS